MVKDVAGPAMGGGWSYYNPVRIIFGVGRLAELAAVGAGRRFLLVTTPGFTRRGVTERIRRLVGEDRLVVYDGVAPNPELAEIEAVAAEQRRAEVDGVIAVGGGSAMDTAKALGVLIPALETGFSLRAHFEQGSPLPQVAALPVIAIPTTAGTGAEVTPFATIWDKANGQKYSLAGSFMFPHTAILDPLLTVSLPEEETVASGLDALSQGLESIWNRNANPVTQSFATRAVKLALGTLPDLLRTPGDAALRANMMEASLLSGLAISVTRTALAHSISYPLTARFAVPHGIACSFTLPALYEYNCGADDGRLVELGHALGLQAPAELRWRLRSLLHELRLGDRLRRYVTSADELLALAPEMFTPGRADNNLRGVGEVEVKALLAEAWDDLAAAS